MKERIAEVIDNCVLAYAQDTTGAAIGGVDRAAGEILELLATPTLEGGEVREVIGGLDITNLPPDSQAELRGHFERMVIQRIHGLCPGHPITEATCGHCNMSRDTLAALVRALSGTPQEEGEAPTCDLCGEVDLRATGGYVCAGCASRGWGDADPDGVHLDLTCALNIGKCSGLDMDKAAAHHLESALRRIVREETSTALQSASSTSPGDQIMPGVFECASCGVVVVASELRVHDGSMVADGRPQDCPNGCGPMWPQTYKAAYRALLAQCDEMSDQLAALRSAPTEGDSASGILRDALEKIANEAPIEEPEYDDWGGDTEEAERWGLAAGAYPLGVIAREALARAEGRGGRG